MWLAAAVSCIAQDLTTVAVTPEPVGKPRVPPERRWQVNAEPAVLLQHLIHGTSQQRRSTFKQLGLQLSEEARVTEAQLWAVNLDADQALEWVLCVRVDLGFVGDGAAFVFKQQEAQWWAVGEFLFKSVGTETVPIALRSVVWPDHKDIVIHQGGSQGTGVGETTLSIYRLLHGRLYRVLETTKEKWTWTTSESNQIEYPNLVATGAPPVITVRRSEQTGQHRRSSQKKFRWDANQFSFVLIPSSTPLARRAR